LRQAAATARRRPRHRCRAVSGLGGDRDGEEVSRSFETVTHFHMEFAELIESLRENVQALVVLVDDMDRCSTETIIETSRQWASSCRRRGPPT
jgi:hypothetical protein